jgi:hypothetical protein
MKVAVIGVLIGLVIAVAVVLLDKGPPTHDAIDDQHKAAAILVARCDAAMSSLELALGSSQSRDATIASRIDLCTRAKAMVEKAQAARSSPQLDVAHKRLLEHLARLGAGSATGSAASAAAGSN